MNPSNKSSLTRRIAEFKVNSLTLETVLKAKHFLRKISLVDVRNVNKVCALFYMWVSNRGREGTKSPLSFLGACMRTRGASQSLERLAFESEPMFPLYCTLPTNR